VYWLTLNRLRLLVFLIVKKDTHVCSASNVGAFLGANGGAGGLGSDEPVGERGGVRIQITQTSVCKKQKPSV